MARADIIIDGTDEQGREIRLEIVTPKTPYGGYILCTVHPQSTAPIQPIVLEKYGIKELILELIKTL